MKASFKALQVAVSQVWGSAHCYIDRDKLQQGIVHVAHTMAGLASVPGSGLRIPDMKHRPWRAAFFRDSDSNSPVFSLRDVVVSAVWSWSKAGSVEDVRSSYKKTFLFPFNPNGWIKLSQVANERQLAATEKIMPAKRNRTVKALQKSSHKYVAVEAKGRGI